MSEVRNLSIGIIGARSFTARELITCCLNHPHVEITTLMARVEEETDIADVFGIFRNRPLPKVRAIDLESLPKDTDVVFLCLPHTVAAEHVPPLLQRGIRVIDLSADFRFRDLATYETVYQVEHPCPELLSRAEYGLPELFRANIRGKTLIGNPGCYPTATTLALAPILKRDMVIEGSLIADCKSGVSGAGRSANDVTHYCNANESIKAYKVASHRHQNEIEQSLTRLAGEKRSITFVPHLTPMDRGILATVYATLKEPISSEKMHALYEKYYKDEPFVRILPPGSQPTTANVARTNYCDIQVVVDDHAKRLVVTSAIDNLLKGASGQALQCLNATFGWDETLGLM